MGGWARGLSLLLLLLAWAGPARADDMPDVRVTFGKMIVRGSLDKAIIRRIMLVHRGVLRACYLEALHRRPRTAGRLDARFIIQPAGHVSHAEARGGELQGTLLAGCVVERIKGWRFPSCKGGGIVIVDVPLWFEVARSRTPEGAAAPLGLASSPADAGSIGVARMEPDGAIVLELRAELPDGGVGDALLRYPPGDPRYKDVLDHLGGLEPGQCKPVPPWR